MLNASVGLAWPDGVTWPLAEESGASSHRARCAGRASELRVQDLYTERWMNLRALKEVAMVAIGAIGSFHFARASTAVRPSSSQPRESRLPNRRHASSPSSVDKQLERTLRRVARLLMADVGSQRSRELLNCE